MHVHGGRAANPKAITPTREAKLSLRNFLLCASCKSFENTFPESGGFSLMMDTGASTGKALKFFFMTTKGLGKHVTWDLNLVFIERHDANHE